MGKKEKKKPSDEVPWENIPRSLDENRQKPKLLGSRCTLLLFLASTFYSFRVNRPRGKGGCLHVVVAENLRELI